MLVERGCPLAVYPDPIRSFDRTVCVLSDPTQVRICQELERNILSLCQPYQKEGTQYNKFWSVAPGYSLLAHGRLNRLQYQVESLARVYDFANHWFGSPLARFGIEIDTSIPTYLRLDAMSSVRHPGDSVSAEVGTVPVGEGEVTAMRQVYDQLFAGRLLRQFTGSAESTVKLLEEAFHGKSIRIVIPPRRMGYRGDYQYVSQFCKQQGLDVEVEEPGVLRIENGHLTGDNGRVDVVYRGFQLSDLEDLQSFPDGQALLKSAARGAVAIYPQVTNFDRKEIIGRLFQPELVAQMEQDLGQETVAVFQELFPWTVVLDRSRPVMVEGKTVDWNFFTSVAAKKAGYILKPIDGREARGLVFSDKVSNKQWLECIHDALRCEKPKYVLQKDCDPHLERFIATFYDREQDSMVEAGGFRDRMCVNTFVSGITRTGQRQVVIGDIDHTLRRNTRLIHTSSDAVHVPVLVV